MTGIPAPLYRQADHPRLVVNEWRPERGAERVADGILMSKSVTNSYLVTTADGDIVINTGMADHGARHRQRYEELLGRPLDVRRIIFTQSHPDHIGGWEAFAGADTDLVGQRQLETLCAERAALAPFFAARNMRVIRAILEKVARESAGSTPVASSPVTLTTRFGDELEFTQGGRRFHLISTPSGEAFDAICVWLPDERTLFTGNYLSAVFGSMPNFYTLRGDRQRSVPGFLRELQRLIDLDAELLITGHGDPLEGATHVRAALTKIRDAVRYMHDETVRLMAAGHSLSEIMAAVELPDALKLSPLGRGPTRWYVRTVWEEYTGWFRMDLTSELYATPVSAIGLDLAELAGGVDAIRHRADELRQSGELEKALHMIEVAVAAAPDDRAVRETEGHILVDLINRTGGVGFDEIGWLEGKLREAASVANAEG